MRFLDIRKVIFLKRCAVSILTAILLTVGVFGEERSGYIKWIDFDVTAQAMKDALAADVASHDSACPLDWIALLSALGAKYGGDFRAYKKADLDKLAETASAGTPLRDCTSNQKLYDYYLQAYGAVLGGMAGAYTEFREENGTTVSEQKYGLIACSPIASGYYYNHYDDFGASRSYGYRRPHLGHDLLGSVGTPVVAVEGGRVEACGWNQYGGWRIGIRSFDGLRYYYYAHLRKDHPYNDIYEGKMVCAGEVIGYLGMTGYSAKENVNNIDTPHLHYGLQIIFDKSQKDGNNQIWIDLYELTKFLYANRVPVEKEASGDYRSLRFAEAAYSPD